MPMTRDTLRARARAAGLLVIPGQPSTVPTYAELRAASEGAGSAVSEALDRDRTGGQGSGPPARHPGRKVSVPDASIPASGSDDERTESEMPGLVAPVADERAGLLAYLAQQRYVLRIATHGLTDEQARATPSASTLSVGGLVKHMARGERTWMDAVLGRYQRSDSDFEAAFRLGADETLAGVLADYDQAAAQTEAVIDGVPDLGQAVPVPEGVPWFPQDVQAWSVRWVLLHLITETARHAGHADIIRESIDGASAFPLMAAVEDWPASPWMRRWEPPTQT